MGFFGNFGKLVTDVVVLPLAVTKDVVNHFDLSSDFDKRSASAKKLEDLKRDLNKLIENK